MANMPRTWTAHRRRPWGIRLHEHPAGPSLTLPIGEVVHAPAAYVRALDLSVSRLDQAYQRTTIGITTTHLRAATPSRAGYDTGELMVDYPGIAVRFA